MKIPDLERKIRALERRNAGGRVGSTIVAGPSGSQGPHAASHRRGGSDALAIAVAVTDFGAVGDGVTDDLGAIQTAIDSLPTAGGTVFFPAGVYAISGPIVVDRNHVTLEGAGYGFWGYFIGGNPGSGTEGFGVSKIKALTAGFDLIRIVNTVADPIRNGLRFADLYLFGNSKTGWGIHADDASGAVDQPVFERLFIHNTAGGLSLIQDSGFIQNSTIMDIGTSPAVEIRGGYFPGITRNVIADNGGPAVRIPNGTLSALIIGNIIGRVTKGIDIDGGSDYVIGQNSFYRNRDTDIEIDGAVGFTVTGNTHSGTRAAGAGVQVGGTTACTGGLVVGNTFVQDAVANGSAPVAVGLFSTCVVDNNSVVTKNGGSWGEPPFGPINFARTRRIAGDVAITSTTWVNVDTALDLSFGAQPGDVVEVGVNGLWSNQAIHGRLDAVSVVGGNPVNSWGHDTAPTDAMEGVGSWIGPASVFFGIGGSTMRKIVAADIGANGTLVLRLRARLSSAGSKTLFANGNGPLVFWARNHGSARY